MPATANKGVKQLHAYLFKLNNTFCQPANTSADIASRIGNKIEHAQTFQDGKLVK